MRFIMFDLRIVLCTDRLRFFIVIIVVVIRLQNMDIEEYGVVCERKEATLHASRQGLPPTPPSSISSDSEGTASASCSPERRDSQTCTQNLRGLLAPRLYVTNGTHTTRQPIHTPLISCQPVRHSLKSLTLVISDELSLSRLGVI